MVAPAVYDTDIISSAALSPSDMPSSGLACAGMLIHASPCLCVYALCPEARVFPVASVRDSVIWVWYRLWQTEDSKLTLP
jgi:hypothetical protein